MSQLSTDLKQLQRSAPTVLTIGAFDGVHRGHQYLIRQTVDRARATGRDSLVVTFTPRPQVILRPGSTQLTGAAEKARLISALGPTTIALLPFTIDFSRLPAAQFLVEILDHVALDEIWVGADFSFGHNRDGNVDFLIRAGARSGFAVHVVGRQGLDGMPISSTRVRELLEAGSITQASELLGHYFRVDGIVTTGFGRGKDLGFPTANVQPDDSQMLPATGIYAAFLVVEGRRLPAAVSVGYNPTFAGDRVVVEAHVLDWDGDLLNALVGVDFVERIREERKFEGVEALVTQMQDDVQVIRRLLEIADEPGELLLSP